MAKYNIYGHVLYSEIKYEELMNTTERIFINALMNGIGSIEQWTEEIWNNIDHEYMIKTLEEIKLDVINSDYATLLKYKNTAIDIDNLIKMTDELANLYEINSIDKFKSIERAYGKHINNAYSKKINYIQDKDIDTLEYLTRQIKDFRNIEQTIPYRHDGVAVRWVTPSTYLSMLYNVNLTRTGWNQTFKDAEYFNNDLVLLETHPRSCPLCAEMQGKVYSRSGKPKYDSILKAYENGVGHPNCKCEFSIYWDKSQLENQYISKTEPEDYENDQKKKAIEREIRRQENDMDLYNMIGNGAEVDKCMQKIEKLKSKL